MRGGLHNRAMHVDHIIFAAGPDGVTKEAERLADILGTGYKDGGFHPRFGTRNHIIPLTDERYLEIVEVLDHPAAEKAAFGQAVRARSEMGGGWLGWAVSVDDMEPVEQRLERTSVPGSRQFPDGRRLEWSQIGIRGLMADPQLPYFLHWQSDPSVLPSALPGDVTLTCIDISGSADRLSSWLDMDVQDELDGVQLNLTALNGHPGISKVHFVNPTKGEIVI